MAEMANPTRVNDKYRADDSKITVAIKCWQQHGLEREKVLHRFFFLNLKHHKPTKNKKPTVKAKCTLELRNLGVLGFMAVHAREKERNYCCFTVNYYAIEEVRSGMKLCLKKRGET